MHLRLKVKDLDCIDCARALEHVAMRIEGVESAKVSFARSTLDLLLRDGQDRRAVVKSLRRKGYETAPVDEMPSVDITVVKGAISKRRLLLTSVCGCLLLAALGCHLAGASSQAVRMLLVAATATGLPLTLLKALAAVRSLSLDMNVLMSIAVVAAAALGEWQEAGVVVFLFSIAQILEAAAMARTRKAIEALMSLSPDTATVVRDGKSVTVDAAQVLPGETIVIKPGQRIPLESQVVKGSAWVDESPITGEPLPVSKEPGSQILAGTMNEDGLIEASVTKPKDESTLARILHLVEHVEESKARVERFIDRFARFYTPAVILAAAAVGLVPYAIGVGDQWIYRSLVILIIACPCALVIATPVAVVSGLTSATRLGILIKGGVHLEQAAQVRAIALDKTGTVTLGRPTVRAIVPLGDMQEDDLLRIAASVESASNHPLAGSMISEARSRGIHLAEPEAVRSIAGTGVSGVVEGIRYYIGKPEFMSSILPDIRSGDRARGRTVVAVATEQGLLGTVEFEDRVRPGWGETISGLRRLGIRRAIIVTGDREEAAREAADATGVDGYHADLLPDEKAEIIQKLSEEFGTVAMVGDGINDAPALAAAQVGVAMGAAGSDIAIETADVALMSDDISRLVPLFKKARTVRNIIRENIAIAVAIKAVFLTMAVAGLATMWMAVFADMGASLIVITNALRLLSDKLDGLTD